jgi:peptidyl-prolyl cis-trans isomerase C
MERNQEKPRSCRASNHEPGAFPVYNPKSAGTASKRAAEPLGNRGSPGLKRGPWGNGPKPLARGTLKSLVRAEPKKRIILVKARSVSLLMAAAFACLALSPAAAADDPVVARVNGVEIKQSDLDYAASDLGPRLANFSAEDRKKVLLQYLIETELIAAAGRTDNLDKSENFPGRMKYYERRALRDAYFDLKIYQAVTDAEAKKIYDEKIGQVKPEQEVHARHILVETEDEAKEIAERLKKGEDFATLAKEKSKDPAAEGGDLGFFTRGQMVKPFEEAAFALDIGQISDPVQSPFGWHIIKVEEKRDQPLPSFDQVKDGIIAQLVQIKAQEVVGSLRKAATVEVVDPTLKKAMEDEKAMDEVAPSGASPASPSGASPSPPDDKSSGGAPQQEDKPSEDAPDKP